MAKRIMKVRAYRHGAKKPNTPDGRPVDELSELGEKQMYAIGESLFGHHFRIALVSPKKRTWHSAALVLGSAEDEPDYFMSVCKGLDYEGVLPEAFETTDLVQAMKAVRALERPTVGDLLALWPQGYGYHVAWRMSVRRVMLDIFHDHQLSPDHLAGDEDVLLVVTHSPVLELATGNLKQEFLPEAAGIELVFEVDEQEATLVSYTVIPPPTVG